MHYQAVLFDMDGVILDSEPLHYVAAQATLAAREHRLTYEQYKQFFAGHTDKEGFKRYYAFLGEAINLQVIGAEKAQMYQKVAATNKLTPCLGVIECIRELADRKLSLALVTGSIMAEAELILKTFAITDLFSVVIAAEDTTHSKPNPEGYLKGAKALAIHPKECIVIEDAPSGVKAAKSAGMRCIAVTTTYREEELREASLIVDLLNITHLESL
jgi:beta-phosphoglucomutase